MATRATMSNWVGCFLAEGLGGGIPFLEVKLKKCLSLTHPQMHIYIYKAAEALEGVISILHTSGLGEAHFLCSQQAFINYYEQLTRHTQFNAHPALSPLCEAPVPLWLASRFTE